MKNQKMKFAIANIPQILRSPRWFAMLFLLPLLAMVHFALAAPTPAAQTPAAEKFEHAKIGFTLSGAHAQARCTACHINNVFKGTPRDCKTCHAPSNPMGTTAKSNNHIATNVQCDVCHKTVIWAPAFMSHVGVTNGACGTCHNGANAKGKADAIPTHIDTTLDCFECHKSTISFAGATSALPANHLPTTQSCSLCHINGTGADSGLMNHAGIFNNCNACHNGQTFAVGMTPKRKQDANLLNGHVNTALDCSSCHFSTATFTGAIITTLPVGHFPTTQVCTLCHVSGYGSGSGVMSHQGITNNCTICHNGQTFVDNKKPASKPSNHVPTTAVTNGAACETCHQSTAVFSGTAMVHTGITTGCANCHNGQTFAVGVKPVSKPVGPPTHIPTTAACETCHAVGQTNVGGFAATPMNHTGMTNNCASCHNDGMNWAGVTIKRKQDATVTHVPTTLDCSSCHNSTTTFKGAAGVLPTGHLVTTQPCSLCHAAGYGTSLTVMSHVGIVSGCTNCHNGQTFAVGMKPKSKSASHFPTTAVPNPACETCHSPSQTSSGGFNNGTMNHTGVTTNCASCHSGTVYAGIPLAKSTNHIPTTAMTNGAKCETCHSSAQTSAGGFLVAVTMSHVGIVNNCAACHADAKNYPGALRMKDDPTPPHVTTSLDCSSCHTSTTTFKGAAGVMPTGHLVTTQPCSLCHAAGYGTSLTVMSHVGIVSGCTNCHNGQTFAVGMKPKSKSASHFPTTAVPNPACETCHSPSQTSSGGFNNGTMNHTGVTTNCASCHNDGFNYAGAPKRKQDDPTPPHVVTALDCSACHSSTTTFTGASGGAMPANHIATAQPCTLCHAAGYSLTLTVMNHTGITTGCANCHNGQTFVGPQTPMKKPTNHIPYATKLLGGAAMQCEFCHKSTAAFNLSVTSTVMHNGSKGNGSGQCTGCHLSGTSYLGVQGRKSLSHDEPGHLDCSDSGCHKPGSPGRGTVYQSW